MATNLRGVVTAPPTPFDRQQALNRASSHRLVRLDIQRGIDGLCVGGSTDKASVQSLSKREQVLETIAEEAKGKIKLIAHVGHISTAESQRLAASAKRYDLDAVSAVTPFYYPFSFGEHYDHYQAIIDSADGLPTVMYNIPALSGVKLILDQINTLITLPGAGALKQTFSDLYQMKQVRREHPGLVLYSGYDEIFVSGLLAGTGGSTGSTYSVMDWRYQGVVKVLKEGGVQTAQRLQIECNEVIDLLIRTGVFRGLGTVLYYTDVVFVPLCRKSFGSVDEEYLPELKALARQLIQKRGQVVPPRSPLPGEGE